MAQAVLSQLSVPRKMQFSINKNIQTLGKQWAILQVVTQSFIAVASIRQLTKLLFLL